MANNDNKQLLILIHSQNSNNDPNDQIYDRENLEDELYFPMYAEFRTDSNSSNDSQPMKINTHAQTIKAQIHTPPTTTVLDTENSYQNVNIEITK